MMPNIAIAASQTQSFQYFDQVNQTFKQSEQQYSAGAEQAKQAFDQAQEQ